MSRSGYLALLLIAVGVAAMAAGGAMVHFGWHHTLGYGGLGLGALLTFVGLISALRSPRFTGTFARRIAEPLLEAKVPGGNRTKALVVAAIIIGATSGTFFYAEYQLSSQSGKEFGLSLNVQSATEVTNPDGSVGVSVLVTAVGGVPPYTFVASWADKINQTSTTGNFTRVFGASVQPSTAVTITAKSSNNGRGYLELTLPAQVPGLTGLISTRTLNIVPSNGQGSQQGSSTTATQTSETSSFVAIVNESVPAVGSSGTSASSTATASASASASAGTATVSTGGFEMIVIVKGASGQPLSGARVTLDGSTTLSTPANGTVAFLGIPEGDHVFVITYGTWSETFPYIAEGSPTVRLYVTVPGE